MENKQLDLIVQLIQQQGEQIKQQSEQIKQQGEQIKQQGEQIAEIRQTQKDDKKELIALIKEVKSELMEAIKDNKADMLSRIETVQYLQREDHKKLDEVYAERKFVTVKFGWQWGAVSLVVAFIASGMTVVFS